MSSVAIQAIQQLHPDIIAAVQAKTLFSKDEESVLSTVSSVCIQAVCALCFSIQYSCECTHLYSEVTAWCCGAVVGHWARKPGTHYLCSWV